MKPRFKARSKLEKWVRANGGTAGVAEKLNVNRTTVQHWCRGYARPQLRSTGAILTLSRGQLTLSDIVSGTQARRGLKRS